MFLSFSPPLSLVWPLSQIHLLLIERERVDLDSFLLLLPFWLFLPSKVDESYLLLCLSVGDGK